MGLKTMTLTQGQIGLETSTVFEKMKQFSITPSNLNCMYIDHLLVPSRGWLGGGLGTCFANAKKGPL